MSSGLLDVIKAKITQFSSPSFRLRFFGHLARLNPEEDHHRVIAAAL